MTLTEAICIIDDIINSKSGLKHKQVTSIEFEDGSGHKFNYSVDCENEKRFIDLSEWVEKQNAIKEIKKWLPYLFTDTSQMGKDWAKVRINQACHKLVSNQ